MSELHVEGEAKSPAARPSEGTGTMLGLAAVSPVQQSTDSRAPLADDFSVLQRVFRLLERIEEREGTGVLTFWREDFGRGHIVIEKHRICLVAAEAPVFGLLLREEPDVGALISSAMQLAKKEGRRFGNVLLEHDPATVARIRRFLCKQNAMGITTIAEAHLDDEAEIYSRASQSAYRWGSAFAPAVGDYDPRLTFSPFEIYLQAAELLSPLRMTIGRLGFTRSSPAIVGWRCCCGKTIVGAKPVFRCAVVATTACRSRHFASWRMQLTPRVGLSHCATLACVPGCWVSGTVGTSVSPFLARATMRS